MSKMLKEIMTTDCATVTLKDNVYEIAVKMKQEDTGFIPVVDDNNKLIGCVTDRDLVLRGYAEKREGSASVEQVMSHETVCASPETTVDEAAKMMAQHQIRRLPVCENGKLVGVVSIGDLAVRNIFEDEAGEALSKISEQDKSDKQAVTMK
ncbi:CBS domain-containing protein [Paenibacillus hamazuiensis]|uniref:CBS domain-containing protein n=1 Tax=Paenibacillus hamazuiensis TaxID=2936508 RepID=UPI00200FB344|nr:CBS domain-containing protein [Paenibacillus hamazuiensis]